jgi:hypothetical protein
LTVVHLADFLEASSSILELTRQTDLSRETNVYRLTLTHIVPTNRQQKTQCNLNNLIERRPKKYATAFAER